MNKLLKILGKLIQWIYREAFFMLAVYFIFKELYIGAIISFVAYVAFSYGKYIDFKMNKFKKRPKDLLDKTRRERGFQAHSRYGHPKAGFSKEKMLEKSAFQTGFDAGCDFILNMEEN